MKQHILMRKWVFNKSQNYCLVIFKMGRDVRPSVRPYANIHVFFIPSLTTEPTILRLHRMTLDMGSRNQVRSSMAAYTGAVRCRVHLATVLPRPPSGHRPGRHLARHARILQVGLHLTQPWRMWTPSRHGRAPRISTRKNPMSGILYRKSRHMPIEA